MSINSRILVAFYSTSGNTRFIAETMAKAVDADVLELVPKEKLNISGAGYLSWGIRQLVRKEERDLEPISYDIADYDLIVVGTPVWTYTLTPPIRTFLKENYFAGKNVAVFCCHDGDKGHTLEDLKSGMLGSRCVGEIDFMSVLRQDKNAVTRKATAWIESLVDK